MDEELLKPMQAAIDVALKAAAEALPEGASGDASTVPLGQPLPPFNLEATTPAEAYPLTALITKVPVFP